MNEYILDELDKNVKNFNEAYEVGNSISYINGYSYINEYLAFSLFFENCFITSDYIFDTGNFQTCNSVFINRFYEKIKKHPLLFKLFRFVFGV